MSTNLVPDKRLKQVVRALVEKLPALFNSRTSWILDSLKVLRPVVAAAAELLVYLVISLSTTPPPPPLSLSLSLSEHHWIVSMLFGADRLRERKGVGLCMCATRSKPLRTKKSEPYTNGTFSDFISHRDRERYVAGDGKTHRSGQTNDKASPRCIYVNLLKVT